MSAPDRAGGCLCGAVRYRVSGVSAFGACHCGMCRKVSGGIFLAVEAMSDALTWERSEGLRLHVSSDWAERGSCATCGSSLSWRMTAEGPHRGMTAPGAGMLDDLEGLDFATEIFLDHKPGAYAFAGGRPRLTGAEVMAQAGQVMNAGEEP